MKSAAEIEAESWDELYAMEAAEAFEPAEPCGCQDWSPEKTEDLPTRPPAPVKPQPEPLPVAGVPDDNRCFFCGQVVPGHEHYCGSRGYV